MSTTATARVTSRKAGKTATFWTELLAGGARAGCQIMKIRGDQAHYWLEKFNFENQRPRKSFDVKRLATAMHKREFALCTVVFYVWNGRPYLVDGQHRLDAIATSNITTELVVAVKVVDSYEEVKDGYANYDSHRQRTKAVRINATSMPDEMQMSTAHCGRMMTAVQFIDNEFKGDSIRAMTPEGALFSQIRENTNGWKVEGLDYLNAICDCPKGMLLKWQKGAVMGVGLFILRHQPEKGYDFLKAAATQVNLTHGTPEEALARVVNSVSSERIGPNRLARLVAACWNAYYEGRRLSDPARGIPLDTRTLPPIVIKGTPYSGE